MKNHDKIAVRLSIIINKLYASEKLDLNHLAEEFNVTKRTLQRDLNERLSFLPIKKENNLYYLEKDYINSLTIDDIKKFAELCGIKNLFPEFNKQYLSTILSKKVYLIKGHNYENISTIKNEFKALESAILDNKIITFIYKEKNREIKPYKLVNIKAIWYLVGTEENEKIKTFTLTQIKNLQITNQTFQKNIKIEKKIENEENWFSNDKFTVLLEIDKNVAYYFKRRDILPNQKIIKILDNKNLIIETKVTFEEEILKLIRYWIPHIKIISPDELNNSLKKLLINYLNTI